ncbi:Pentatricopeptide repeat-containing protein [Heracleum sosnowskyi]|uniref:Pentatricopeptide repeat-containing protein n=1 Tax=Heracleum sosnowskyi TaxID=360622 RepID=A0AAD8ISH2_9APIA|nr:Pentatricopeptide repeat-containing protein [Heracleum sosnowskyi]
MRNSKQHRPFCNYLISLLLNHYNCRVIQQIHAQAITKKSQSHKLINTLLRHYALSDSPQQALSFFKHLHRKKPFSFDSFVLSFIVKSSANLQDSRTGSQLHCVITKSGFGIHVYVQTALMNMYVDCGWLGDAHKVFDEMPQRNCVSWNVMITGFVKWGDVSKARELFDSMPDKNVVSWTGIIDGYTRMNRADEALCLFRRMVDEGIKPSELTMLVVFPSVWNKRCLELCQCFHTYTEKSGFSVSDIRVSNSLIAVYAKCGNVEGASKVFECISDEQKNVVSWTSIISCYATYGMVKEAVENFNKMENMGFKPNRVTFLCIINACSHGGLVDEGLHFFRKMVYEWGIVPDIKHYGCLVDMLGRAGRLDEAENIAMNIPTNMISVVIWRTLLGACSFHGNAEMGERVTRRIMEMESGYAGDYVLLSNIFVDVGRFTDSERVRGVMDMRNALKVPGFSSV